MRLTNGQIKQYVAESRIRISGFDPSRLGPDYYRMPIGRIIILRTDEDGLIASTEHSLELKGQFAFAPGEYVTVGLGSTIVLGDRLAAGFEIASLCVERGLALNSGRVQPRYDKQLHVGLRNCFDSEVYIGFSDDIVRVYFEEYPADAPISYDDTNSDYQDAIETLRPMLDAAKRIDDQMRELAIEKQTLLKRLLGTDPN